MTTETHRLVVESDVGSFLLEADDTALTRLLLPGSWSGSEPVGSEPVGSEPVRSGPVGSDMVGSDRAPAHLLEAAEQLRQYLDGERREFDVPLDTEPPGTEFQHRVWFTLAEIPYGETISYAELARWVGRPTAFRAVGQANGANPLPVFLPCHRVVASGGKLGGYGGGLTLKRRLLAVEGHPLGVAIA